MKYEEPMIELFELEDDVIITSPGGLFCEDIETDPL